MNVEDTAKEVGYGTILVKVYNGKVSTTEHEVLASIKPDDNSQAVAWIVRQFKDIQDNDLSGQRNVTFNFRNGKITQIVVPGHDLRHYGN